MKDFLIELLQMVATAAIPVCTVFLVRFLRRRSEQIGAQTDSLITKELLAEVTETVTTAVTYTSQTYADALKKGNVFNRAAQTETSQKSKDKTLSLLSATAVDVLSEIHRALDAYPEAPIKSEVRVQKSGIIALREPLTAN